MIAWHIDTSQSIKTVRNPKKTLRYFTIGNKSKDQIYAVIGEAIRWGKSRCTKNTRNVSLKITQS